jgi:hypothetical protein
MRIIRRTGFALLLFLCRVEYKVPFGTKTLREYRMHHGLPLDLFFFAKH